MNEYEIEKLIHETKELYDIRDEYKKHSSCCKSNAGMTCKSTLQL